MGPDAPLRAAPARASAVVGIAAPLAAMCGKAVVRVSRVYAETPQGERVLVRLECDGTDCKAHIKPNPQIAESGWMTKGWCERGITCKSEYCPECWPRYAT